VSILIVETTDSALNQQSDGPDTPSAPQARVADSDKSGIPYSPSNLRDQETRRLRFVDAVTIAQ